MLVPDILAAGPVGGLAGLRIAGDRRKSTYYQKLYNSVHGYNYSDANKNSDIVWTVDILDKYLVNPHAVVSGTKMGYPGQKYDQKRADIIAYLATLKLTSGPGGPAGPKRGSAAKD